MDMKKCDVCGHVDSQMNYISVKMQNLISEHADVCSKTCALKFIEKEMG